MLTSGEVVRVFDSADTILGTIGLTYHKIGTVGYTSTNMGYEREFKVYAHDSGTVIKTYHARRVPVYNAPIHL